MVYNNAPGIFQGALAGESAFMVISVSGVDEEDIEELSSDFEIEASVTLTLKRGRLRMLLLRSKHGRVHSYLGRALRFDSRRFRG